jgi:hypothetical protein
VQLKRTPDTGDQGEEEEIFSMILAVALAFDQNPP